MAIKMIKTKVKMNTSVYLGMSMLDISKTLMYEFWYDFINPKQQWNCTQRRCIEDRAKLCYIDTDSFITLIKTEDFYKDVANVDDLCLKTVQIAFLMIQSY